MNDLLDAVSFAAQKALAVWSRQDVFGSAVALCLLLILIPGFKGHGGWRGYLGKSFRTDAVYTAFYLGGFYAFFISGPVYRFLSGLVEAHAPFLRLGLLAHLPAAAHFVLLFVVMDGINYWVHRALHASRILWAFHSVHHSQEVLTPLTNFRFHFADIFVRTLVQFVPGLLLGTPAGVWVPSIWIQTSLEALAHSDLDWSYGPLGRLLVSPRFHRVHHSVEARDYNRNFGSSFAFWDAFFGTCDRRPDRPRAYGVPEFGVPESFLRQMVFPFVRLARRQGRPEARSVDVR